MTSIASSVVQIQTSPQSVPSTPSWLGEVAVVAHYLMSQGVVEQIAQQVRFARPRFGHYDSLDFVAVLMGYALSGEPTLEAYYARLLPFARPFMALFGRNRLPHRSTLSRFLAAIDQPTVQALRTLCATGSARTTGPLGGRTSRGTVGSLWRAVARLRCRWDPTSGTSAGITTHSRSANRISTLRGRLRSWVVFDASAGKWFVPAPPFGPPHTQQWMGTFGERGNGDYRGELLRAAEVVAAYQTPLHLPLDHAIVRLDGLYGNGAIVKDLDTIGLGYVMRGKDYDLLDLPEIQARLALPPDQQTTHPETGTSRALFDCSDVLLTPTGLKAAGSSLPHILPPPLLPRSESHAMG
jgi:hypothetical protein